MGIQIKNIDTIRGQLKGLMRNVEFDIIQAMKFAGEDFVKDARKQKKSQGGFGDVTGNLRSSIGFAILKDGEEIFGDFKGNANGIASAKAAISEIPKNKGLQMIGIAGMNYASIVEGKGMNVISRQAETLIIDLKDYIKEIENKYKTR